MNNTIKLKRLQDIIVKGNFSINCDNNDEIIMLHQCFFTLNNYIKFEQVLQAINFGRSLTNQSSSRDT